MPAVNHSAKLAATLTVLLATALLPGCMTASSDGTAWRIATVGTDLAGLDISGTALRAATIAQSPGITATLAEVRKMWSSYLLTAGLKHITDQYYDHQGNLTDQATTLQLEKLKNAQSTADAKAALATLQATQAAETSAAALLSP